MKNRLFTPVVTLLATGLLAACGEDPGTIEPPIRWEAVWWDEFAGEAVKGVNATRFRLLSETRFPWSRNQHISLSVTIQIRNAHHSMTEPPPVQRDWEKRA